MHQMFQTLSIVSEALRPFFFTGAALALAIFAVGTFGRIWLWTKGKPRPNDLLAGMGWRDLLKLSATKMFSSECLLATRTFARSPIRGIALLCIVWGSLILLASIFLSALLYVSPAPLLNQAVSRVLTLLLDVAGGLLLIGLLMALARRYLFRPERWINVPGDGLVLFLFALNVISGFLMEGARLAGGGWTFASQWPVGALFGVVMAALARGDVALLATAYPTLYLLHAILALALIAYVPFSRLFHIFASQITTFAAREERSRFREPAAWRPVCKEQM